VGVYSAFPDPLTGFAGRERRGGRGENGWNEGEGKEGRRVKGEEGTEGKGMSNLPGTNFWLQP